MLHIDSTLYTLCHPPTSHFILHLNGEMHCRSLNYFCILYGSMISQSDHLGRSAFKAVHLKCESRSMIGPKVNLE
jgi:hypothetical protein